MSARAQNETKFGQWQDLPDGSRLYSREVAGRHGWRARYLKLVDQTETTLRFWQEIYDDQNRLVETHEKYPVDTGHRKV